MLLDVKMFGVALVFLISSLKIVKSFQNNCRGLQIPQALKKYLKCSSGPTLSFCPNLVKYRFKNNFMFLREYIDQSRRSRSRRIKCAANFVLSGSKIVKQYDPVIIERIIRHVLGPSTAVYISLLKALHSD